ncbi:MAG: DUF2203 domain-containing protein [candidate division FCPU426 bacterium]
MAENRSGIKIFTLPEANAQLPAVRKLIAELRDIKRQVVGMQAKVDIEELTATTQAKARKAGEPILREIEEKVGAFHKSMEALNAIGCELKDLEKGLVDFYGIRGDDVVYLCWVDGEEKISHWHTLESGFQGRQKLEE